MSRDGSGVYSKPGGTTAVSGATISSSAYNTFCDDLVTDLNAARPITSGGTGATNAATALSNLGGQPVDADLTAIAALGYSAKSLLTKTAANTWALTTIAANVESFLGAADYAAMRTQLGLVIGTNVQAYDADLTTWAGLTPSAFFQTLVDDADAATFRNTLGLGTAAVKNTGTSGNNVPLLDGANTWSAAQDVSNGAGRVRLYTNGDGQFYRAGGAEGYLYLNSAQTRHVGFDGSTYVAPNAEFVINGWTAATTNNTLTLSNKTLSSPTLSGTVAGTPTWGSVQVFPSGSAIGSVAVGLLLNNTATDYLHTIDKDNTGVSFSVNSGSRGFRWIVNGSVVSSLTSGGIQAAVQVSSETSGTLTSASSNKQVNASGDVTINDGVHAANDRIEIYAGGSARSIIQDTGMTLRLDGTATTGTRTLAARGRAAIFFVSNSEAIVSGMGVS